MGLAVDYAIHPKVRTLEVETTFLKIFPTSNYCLSMISSEIF